MIRLPETPYIQNENVSAQLVVHNNPFDPNDKQIMIAPSGVSVYAVLNDLTYDMDSYDMVISRNQEIVDNDFIIEDTDIINFVLVPKGGGNSSKQIITVVAMVALVIASQGAGGAAFAGALGAGATVGTAVAIGYVAQVGVMILGGMLISSLLKPNVPQTANTLGSFEQSNTYGWNVQGNPLNQGTTVPVLYGTHRVTPQYIGKYLQTQNDTQILKALLSIGEGPLDSINFVQINDQDISTYNNVSIETRLGTNDQTIIPDFNDTWTDQGLNKKLTTSDVWQYATTLGNTVTSITVGISLPSGLYYANDSGGLSDYSVFIDIEYKSKSSNTWLSYQNSSIVVDTIYYYVDQSPIQQTIIQRFGIVQNYGIPYADSIGPFDVYRKAIPWKGATSTVLEYVGTVASVPLTATGQTIYPPGASYQDPNAQMVWTETKKETSLNYFSITAAQSSAIRRAYTATNLPPDQYDVRVRFYQTPVSSSRYVSTTYFEFLQEAVSDDFTYPNSALLGISIQATDQLSGGLPKVTCIASRITGTYGRLDNPAWACLDLLMNTRYGAGITIDRINLPSFQTWADYCTAQNFTVNIYLDQTIDLSQSLQLVGQLGRGVVMQYGSEFRALVDMPNILPTQGFLFSMGNIIQNSFNETFLPLKDRANIIEVTFYNKDNDYAREVLEVSQGNYDLVNQSNKTSINLIGCVDKEQALRQAKFHLNQNRYLTITATWETSIDAINCQVGDIVNVAHDVPQWGYSGRIISNTANTIIVDRTDLVMVNGTTYYIQVSDASTDEQVYRQVLSIVGDTLTIAGTALGTLGAYSVYSFGEVNRHAKKMRVLSISTANELKRKITAIEYNDNVYNDAVVVPEPELVADLNTKNLLVSEYLEVNGNTFSPVVSLSWNGASLSYDVKYKRASDTSYLFAGTARSNTFTIPNLQEGVLYDFLVDGAYAQYLVKGKTAVPDPVINLTGSEFANTFTLQWNYPVKPLDFSYFEIIADSVVVGTALSNTFSTYIATTKAVSFSVVAVDTTGNKSATSNIVIAPQGLASVTGLKAYYINEYTKITWDTIVDPRSPIDYEIRMGTIWDNGLVIGRTNIPEYTIAANGTYMVKAHYQYPTGVDLYSTTEAQITVTGAVLPKNVVATYDEKATGWLGTKTNLYVNPDGNLELMSSALDTIPIIDTELTFDYAGGIQPNGIYEIPPEHIVDIGTAQVCRIWMDYKAEGRIITERVDSIPNFDSWVNVNGYSDKYKLIPQISIAQNDGIFGPWVDFTIGEYIGRKFKFRGLFYSLDPSTTCILSQATFYIDMPDKIQSANSVVVPITGTTITYPVAFQVPPNVQITIVNAADGDDAILTNETNTSFDLAIKNGGVAVQRNINWLSKGY